MKLKDYLVIQDGKAFVVAATGMTVKPEYTILGDFVGKISHSATIIDLSKVVDFDYDNRLYTNQS